MLSALVKNCRCACSGLIFASLLDTTDSWPCRSRLAIAYRREAATHDTFDLLQVEAPQELDWLLVSHGAQFGAFTPVER